MNLPSQKSNPDQTYGRDIVLVEANFDRPSPRGAFEAMAKRRFQDPDPEIVGNWWWIRVYQDEFSNGRRIRKRKRIKLAPASMPVREVQKLAAEYLRPLNQGLINAGSATTFETFVKNIYSTTELPLLASSTQDRNGGIIKNYLVPTFGALCLRDLTPLTLQKYISKFQIRGREESQSEKSEENGKRELLSRESVDKIRDVLSSILRSAVKYGYLITNPAEKLQVPADKRGNPDGRAAWMHVQHDGLRDGVRRLCDPDVVLHR
jgi:hypothetical protein